MTSFYVGHSNEVPDVELTAEQRIIHTLEQENTALRDQLLAATQRRMDAEGRPQTVLDVLPADHAMWTCTRCGSLSDIPANKLSKAIANHHHHTGPAEKHVYDAEEPHND